MSIKKYLTYLYAALALMVIWFAVSAMFNRPIIPSPIDVFLNLRYIFVSKILAHAGFSLYRIFMGLALSVVIGVPVGLAMGYNKALDSILSPVVYFLYPIPKIALLPVVMLLFGLGELSKIVMIMLIVIFQVIVSSRDTVKGIPKETYYSLKSLGAGGIDIFREIILPASTPELLTSIRVGLGTAVSVLFFTETFGTEYGMGYFIMDSWMRVDYLDMYAGIIVLSIIGLCLFLAVDMLEFLLCPWKR